MFFKNKKNPLSEIASVLCEISDILREIRNSGQYHTGLLRQIADNQISCYKETNKAQETAPAPEKITWQEAVLTLKEACSKVDGVDCAVANCPMYAWCSIARGSGDAPQYWELPDTETKEG